MLDLAKQNGSDITIPLIEENLTYAPEMQILPARKINGTTFTSLIRTSFPTVPFRSVNNTRATVKSEYQNKIHNTFYLDGQMEVDNAIASGSERGTDFVLTTEASGIVKGAMITLGKQVWYGVSSGGDLNGFPGARDIVDTSLVLDAGGTTANTGSSVYLICAMPGFMGLIFGNNTVLTPQEWRKQTYTDSSGNKRTVWNNSIEGWVGVEWLNKYAVVRIKNLTADPGKGLTDTLLAQAIELLPVGIRPTHIFMSRRSRRQLQTSRTVSIFGQDSVLPSGGQAVIAPTPISYEGIPIVPTDSILYTDAIA